MDFEKFSPEKKEEIEQAIIQHYESLPDIDMEQIRLNMLEKCVFMNPSSQTQCWECIDGYGPYPVSGTIWECRKCNQTIDNCQKCLWMFSYDTSPPSILYGCQNCTDGYYPVNATRIDRRYHRGDWCTRCSQNCKTCLTLTWCSTCDSSREVYLPPGTLEIEPVRYCRYTMEGKFRICGFLLVVFLGGLTVVWKCLFTDVHLIRKKFLISQPTSKGGVDITELMTREIKAAPGRKGSFSSGSTSYLPRLSTVKKITSILQQKK